MRDCLKRVGSFMILWNPNFEVTNSIFAPSVVALSSIYLFLHFILKSPNTMISCELHSFRVYRVEIICKFFRAITYLTRRSIKKNKFAYCRVNL